MMRGASERNRSTTALIADAVVALVHRAPVGSTAMTNSRLLTSTPTLTDSIGRLLGVAAPDLMRVRARGPVNCSGFNDARRGRVSMLICGLETGRSTDYSSARSSIRSGRHKEIRRPGGIRAESKQLDSLL